MRRYLVSVFLSLIYATILTPVAILLRILARDPLRPATSLGGDSYWRAVSTDSNDVEQYTRLY